MYGEQNLKVFRQLEAIFERLEYGTVRVDFDIHAKRIVSITVYGKQRIKPRNAGKVNRQNQEIVG